jgi:undecaprenyl-diphosphatase
MIRNVVEFNTYLSFKNIPETFLASFLIWIIIALLLFYFLRGSRKEKKTLAFSLVAGLIAWTFCTIVKDIIPQAPRPFRLNGFPPLTITIPLGSSFPSGHTALAFGLASYMYLKKHKAGIFFIVLALFVAVGRVWSNVHFPIDVAGGAILGIFSALFVDFLQSNLSKNR